MSPAPSRFVPWICLLLAVLTAATFYPVLRNGFVNWDDIEHVVRNPDMNPPTFAAMERYWAKPYFGLWVPASYTVWLATAAIAPRHGEILDPIAFHAVNLVLHALAVILVFLIVRRFTQTLWPAAAGAALFAVHPIQVEAVAWVSGLRDVLSGAMSLAAICTYLNATDKSGHARVWRIALATLFFTVALLSKPTAAVTPVLLAILLGPRARAELRWLALWLLMSAADLFIACVVQPSAEVYRPPLWARPIVALDALAFYLRKILMPFHFAMDYSRSPDWLLANPARWWPAGFMSVAIIVLVLFRRRLSCAISAAAIGICALLPVLGFVPFNYQYYSTVADRYAYLAMLGPAVAVAALIARLPRIAGSLAIILIVALACSSNRQSRVWQSTTTLCDHTLKTNPHSVAALNILSFESRAAGNWQFALQYNNRALQNKPNDPLLLFDRANILRDAGQLDAAADLYARALALRPTDPQIRNNYAVLFAQQGKDAEAQSQFAKLLQQFPNDAQARANWATYLAAHGQRDEALAEFRRALVDDPRNTTAQRGIELLTPQIQMTNDK